MPKYRELKCENPSYTQKEITLPAYFKTLMEKREVTFCDILVIWEISSQVHHPPDSGHFGCFSSYRHIAKRINSSETYVSESITKLIKMGIVIEIQMNGLRYLELEWSRIKKERDDLPGEYGRLLREEFRKRELEDFGKNRNGGFREEPKRNIRSTHSKKNEEKTHSRPGGAGDGRGCETDGKPSDKDTSSTKQKHQEVEAKPSNHQSKSQSATTTRARAKSQNVQRSASKEPESTPAHRTRDFLLTRSLIEGLRKKHKLLQGVSEKKWAVEICKLKDDLVSLREMSEKEAYDYIQEVMDSHLESIGEDPYAPHVHSASSFREKFVKIEASLERRVRKQKQMEEPEEDAERYLRNNQVPPSWNR